MSSLHSAVWTHLKMPGQKKFQAEMTFHATQPCYCKREYRRQLLSSTLKASTTSSQIDTFIYARYYATTHANLPDVLIYEEKLGKMFTFTPLQGAQSESSASQSLLELDGGVKVLIDVGWDETFDVAKLKEIEK